MLQLYYSCSKNTINIFLRFCRLECLLRNFGDFKSKLSVEIRKRLRNFYFLRTNRLAATAAHARRGTFILRHLPYSHRRDKPAVCKAMLVVERYKQRNIQALRTVAYAIAALRTGQRRLCRHILSNFKQHVALALGYGLKLPEGLNILLKLLEIGHSRQRNRNLGDSL